MANGKTTYVDKLLNLALGDRLNLAGLIFMALAYINIDAFGVVIDIPEDKESGVFLAGMGMLVTGIFLIIWRTIAEKQEQVEERSEAREAFPASERLELFTKNILNQPRSKGELSEMDFDMYDGMLKHDLYQLLMQASAKECVLSGLATYSNGKYIGRDVTEATIIRIPE